MAARLKLTGNESFQTWGSEPVQVIKMLMMPISFVCSVEVAANGSHDLTNAGDEEK